MILPIHLYGSPVLRKKAIEIDETYPELDKLISDMFETMNKAEGIGLAAPQIGKSIRLMIIDASALAEDNPELKDFKRIYINPEIVSSTDNTALGEEGCLSLPGIRENVRRSEEITVKYYDENFNEKEETYKNFTAIIFQHEFDHLEGKLFIDKIASLRKHLINKKLNAIKKGKVSTFYKTKV